MKMIKIKSCRQCPSYCKDYQECDGVEQAEEPLQIEFPNLIHEDCPLEDYEETIDTCPTCGCTELLCGHNKRR